MDITEDPHQLSYQGVLTAEKLFKNKFINRFDEFKILAILFLNLSDYENQ